MISSVAKSVFPSSNFYDNAKHIEKLTEEILLNANKLGAKKFFEQQDARDSVGELIEKFDFVTDAHFGTSYKSISSMRCDPNSESHSQTYYFDLLTQSLNNLNIFFGNYESSERYKNAYLYVASIKRCLDCTNVQNDN